MNTFLVCAEELCIGAVDCESVFAVVDCNSACGLIYKGCSLMVGAVIVSEVVVWCCFVAVAVKVNCSAAQAFAFSVTIRRIVYFELAFRT